MFNWMKIARVLRIVFAITAGVATTVYYVAHTLGVV